jgi:hypothetical protein
MMATRCYVLEEKMLFVTQKCKWHFKIANDIFLVAKIDYKW